MQDFIFMSFYLNHKRDMSLQNFDPYIQFYSDQISESLHSSDYYIDRTFDKKLLKTATIITVSLYYTLIFKVFFKRRNLFNPPSG